MVSSFALTVVALASLFSPSSPFLLSPAALPSLPSPPLQSTATPATESHFFLPYKPPSSSPSVLPVPSLTSLKTFLNSSPKSSVKVVRFSSPTCRSCATSAPHFARFSRDHSASSSFASVTDPDLTAALGVVTIPFAQVYIGGMLVESLKVTRRLFPAFEKSVESYESGFCSMLDAPQTEWEADEEIRRILEGEEGGKGGEVLSFQLGRN